jgi:hypothetical protein
MYARALLLVLLAACGSTKEPPKLTFYTLRDEVGACVVTEACPPGVACAPRAPYAHACAYRMAPTYAAPDDPRMGTYARLGSECFDRPPTCTERACLGEPRECPPPPGAPPPTSAWRVTRTGDSCAIEPIAPSSITRAEPPFTMRCPPGYELPIAGVRRDLGDTRCRVDTGEECPDGALCEPETRDDVDCPARRR